MAHATTPTGIRRLVDNANFRMQMQMNGNNVGGVQSKARIVKPSLSNLAAPGKNKHEL
jgi:hypothetical protein